MFRIKTIDRYVFKRFITLFVMTFVICIFILLMQFLWKHFNDLIGKGIGVDVIAEFFLYAIASLVPMALPLAILLASIMTFGNMGENFELTAMKSAGVSLFRIIRPLILFITIISISAFYFSNNVLPITQTKLWTLILSIRQKSPELDIPTGEFYSGIGGVNIYVHDKKNGLLKDMMIYDFTNGFENATVILADSGRIKFSEDKKYLLLELYDGESFDNLKSQSFSNNSNSVPYRRESFGTKEILIDFDSEFSRFDENVLQDQHVSKNLSQLAQSIDSASKLVSNLQSEQAKEIVRTRYFGREMNPERNVDSMKIAKLENYNPDTLFYTLDKSQMEIASNSALQKANEMKNQIEYTKIIVGDPTMYRARHQIEFHRKFTLSFACLIFFFIGAPLGAIIRKGGLGAPVVISVIMFIFYYIIDNTGYKMAREGIMTAFEGMWLSSSILLPIGIFLTYKAAIDATLFNPEEYVKIFQKLKLFFIQKISRKN